ncbi:MAG: hypothetical protein AB7O97_05920 [Planctomycetota bacterium]
MPKPILPHPDHHDLHGFTIAADTGTALYVGRCHDMDEAQIRMVDVGVHEYGADRAARRAHLEQVVRWGHFAEHARLVLQRADVVWLETIGRLAEHGVPADD